MIAIIADDLSGAAELAGAAAQCGLRAEVHTTFDPQSEAEVIAVDTGTRSLPPEAAAQAVSEVARAILQARPAWIYKKTDSVLRGHVRAEIEATLAATGQQHSLLISANPGKGRIIRGGSYFVQGVPLAETAFAHDPEHPRHSSVVRELLGPNERIKTPDAADTEALARHATTVNNAMLPAGGVEFFQALLEAKGISPTNGGNPDSASGATLFVCGSAAAWRLGREAECQRRSIPVATMPSSLLAAPMDARAIAEWTETLCEALESGGSVMLAIGRNELLPGAKPQALVTALATVGTGILNRVKVSRVLLEGGATATAFLQQLGWKKLRACPCSWAGVAALFPVTEESCTAPLLLIKPGSYPWPAEVWPLR